MIGGPDDRRPDPGIDEVASAASPPDHPSDARHRHALPGWWLLRASRHFWASDVNASAVEGLDPQAGEHVLDLGAGLGPATTAIAREVGPTGRVVAIDPSGAMRAILRLRRLFVPARRHIIVRDGTGERLPLPDASIDAVVGMNVIHHLRDLPAAAAELARVLRADGRLLLVDEDLDDPGHTFHGAGDHGAGRPSIDGRPMAEALRLAAFTDVDEQREPVGGQPAVVVRAKRSGPRGDRP